VVSKARGRSSELPREDETNRDSRRAPMRHEHEESIFGSTNRRRASKGLARMLEASQSQGDRLLRRSSIPERDGTEDSRRSEASRRTSHRSSGRNGELKLKTLLTGPGGVLDED